MINTSAHFSSTLRLEMLSASVATPIWGAEARLTAQASRKHSINCVQPTQQAISLLTDLYPICHVDPAKQTFSVTWLQMFLSHRPIANNLQFGFIPGRQGSAPEPYEDPSYCLHLRGFLSYQKKTTTKKPHKISATAKQQHEILLRINIPPKIFTTRISKGWWSGASATDISPTTQSRTWGLSNMVRMLHSCIVISLHCFTATEIYLLIKTYETVKQFFQLILWTDLSLLLVNYGWLCPMAF